MEHAPDSPLEKRRVEDAGGEINYRSGIARIGGVSMSRALGDLDYKKPRVNRLAGHDLSDLAGVETGLAPGRTAIHDLVSNKAHFTVRTLHGQSLILLASDGVGSAKEAEECTRLAVDGWQSGKEAKQIADELTSSIDGGRRSMDIGMEGSGLRRRRRSSIASLKDWIRDR